MPIQRSTRTRRRSSHAVCKFALPTSLSPTHPSIQSPQPDQVYMANNNRNRNNNNNDPSRSPPMSPPSPLSTPTTSSHYLILLPHHPPPPSSRLQKNQRPPLHANDAHLANGGVKDTSPAHPTPSCCSAPTLCAKSMSQDPSRRIMALYPRSSVCFLRSALLSFLSDSI